MDDQSDAPVLTDVRANAIPSPDSLLGFCDAIAVNRAYERSSWNVDRYVKRMVQLIDTEDADPRIVLAAMEILRKHALESLQLSGRLRAPGSELLPRGIIEAEVLPPADMALLENIGARTQSMLRDDDDSVDIPSETDEAPIPEENHDANDPQDGDDKSPAKGGGSEDGGSYDTEQVVGHRPPAATRSGLCSPDVPSS